MGQNDSPADAPRSTLPSYRKRYTQIFMVLAIASVLVSTVAYHYVVSRTQAGAEEAAVREQSIAVLNDTFAQLYLVRRDLHELLLTPFSSHRARLEKSLGQLENALSRLAEQAVPPLNGDFAAIAASLHKDADILRGQVAELIDIRHDPKRWLPATTLIDDELQTNQSLFVVQLDAMIDSLRHPPGTDLRDGLIALFDLQMAWLRMVDELRLVIANRFGAYSPDPVSGMQTRAQNVELYARQVDLLLDSLISDSALAADDPLLADGLQRLSKHAGAWMAAYRGLLTHLESDEWRKDLTFMRNRIDPQLQAMQQRLEMLRVELQLQRRRQVDTLAGISIGMGNVLIAALGAMLLLGVAGFLSLDRFILRPILALAESLKAHAEPGRKGLPKPPVVTETRDLLHAFDEMRAQVRQREQELNHLAHHDSLTGLPNRTLFRQRLAQAVRASQQHGLQAGLLFMDLDRFKQINDSYGHAAGDQMLVEISNRLLTVFRQDDTVARFGGDEFAVLLENIHEREEMTRLADKALSAIERPYAFGGQLFYSGASIGIAVVPDDGVDPDRLIQLADAAMYASKQDEGSSYRYVSGDMATHAAAQHAFENELRAAIQQHELELHFQPVVSVRDGSMHCYEALLRWPHAEQGMLQPAAFMDTLADAGMCTSISDWALDQIEIRRPTPDAVVSINLSARLLHDDDFSRRLFERIDQERLQPTKLILEITEDTLETDLRAATRVLQALKNRGVRIALDDFGTGQASLSHLRRFPFDYIKIDQSFVSGIGTVPNDEKLIEAIIGLAHSLGMTVVAEGVETDRQRAFLAQEACDYIQGYLVGRPSAAG